MRGNDDNRASCGCSEKISEGTKSTKLNSQVESAFEGARKITSEEYQAGDRFAVQRHEDNLKLGTEVRKYVLLSEERPKIDFRKGHISFIGIDLKLNLNENFSFERFKCFNGKGPWVINNQNSCDCDLR